MFNLGMGEIVVILLLALIVLGPHKLPEMASGLGKIIKDVRKAASNLKSEIQIDEAIRKPFEELRDAATLPTEVLKRRDELRDQIERARLEAERIARETEAAAVAIEGAAPTSEASAATTEVSGLPPSADPPAKGGGTT